MRIALKLLLKLEADFFWKGDGKKLIIDFRIEVNNIFDSYLCHYWPVVIGRGFFPCENL